MYAVTLYLPSLSRCDRHQRHEFRAILLPMMAGMFASSVVCGQIVARTQEIHSCSSWAAC